MSIKPVQVLHFPRGTYQEQVATLEGQKELEIIQMLARVAARWPHDSDDDWREDPYLANLMKYV